MGLMTSLMRRGDIVWATLDPVRRPEASKRRPVVVVSADRTNRTTTALGRGTVTVVPVTTRTHRVYPWQVLLPPEPTGLDETSLAQADQIRAISLSRIGDTIGHVPADLMARIDDAIRLHLNL